MTKRKWIKKVIRNRGGLTRWVQATFGDNGFTMHGSRRVIRADILEKLARGDCPVCDKSNRNCVCPERVTVKRAVLAETLRGFH